MTLPILSHPPLGDAPLVSRTLSWKVDRFGVQAGAALRVSTLTPRPALAPRKLPTADLPAGHELHVWEWEGGALQ